MLQSATAVWLPAVMMLCATWEHRCHHMSHAWPQCNRLHALLGIGSDPVRAL